jgi:N4-gp56 family major capsid protein
MFARIRHLAWLSFSQAPSARFERFLLAARLVRRVSAFRRGLTIGAPVYATLANFVPEIWSAVLLSSLKKAQVFARLANRDYEGEIANQGDTVHINSVSRPTINTYTVGATITVQQLATADRTLAIDQADYFAFEVDDVDKRQAAGSVLEEALVEASYGLSDKVDQLLAGKYTDVATANKVNSGTAVAVTTGDIAYTQFTQLKRKCDEANIPTIGRWTVIPPWVHALLLDTNKFAANPALAGTPQAEMALINGFVGRIVGFDVFVSNNAVLVTGDDYICLAGTSNALTFAEQINQVEAYRMQTTFADAVRGLHLYGAKVTRPDGLAYLLASQT